MYIIKMGANINQYSGQSLLIDSPPKFHLSFHPSTFPLHDPQRVSYHQRRQTKQKQEKKNEKNQSVFVFFQKLSSLLVWKLRLFCLSNNTKKGRHQRRKELTISFY